MEKIINIQKKENDVNELIIQDLDDKNIKSFFVSNLVVEEMKIMIGDVIDGINSKEY